MTPDPRTLAEEAKERALDWRNNNVSALCADVCALADAVLRLVGKPGSERCGDCGRHYLVMWAAPNELWNRIWGDGSGMLCPDCFSKRCEAAGVLPFFVCFP